MVWGKRKGTVIYVCRSVSTCPSKAPVLLSSLGAIWICKTDPRLDFPAIRLRILVLLFLSLWLSFSAQRQLSLFRPLRPNFSAQRQLSLFRLLCPKTLQYSNTYDIRLLRPIRTAPPSLSRSQASGNGWRPGKGKKKDRQIDIR